MGLFNSKKRQAKREAEARDKEIKRLLDLAINPDNYETIHEELWSKRAERDGSLSKGDQLSKDLELETIKRLPQSWDRYERIQKVLPLLHEANKNKDNKMHYTLMAKMREGTSVSLPVHYDHSSKMPMTEENQLLMISGVETKTDRLFTFYVDPANIKVSIPRIKVSAQHFGEWYPMTLEADLLDEPLIVDANSGKVLGEFTLHAEEDKTEIKIVPYQGVVKSEKSHVDSKQIFKDSNGKESGSFTTMSSCMVESPKSEESTSIIVQQE
jgi:hypothetical protein